MKTFDQLTPEQQGKAVDGFVNEIIEIMVDVRDAFPDCEAKVKAALEKAERMQTPWFAGRYVYDACADRIKEEAFANAKEALYRTTSDPRIIGGVA